MWRHSLFIFYYSNLKGISRTAHNPAQRSVPRIPFKISTLLVISNGSSIFYFEGKVRKCKRGEAAVFLSVTSWKSRSVRFLLEIYHVPRLSSFDFNQEKKKLHIFPGEKTWEMSSTVSLLWLSYAGSDPVVWCQQGKKNVSGCPLEPPLTDHLPDRKTSSSLPPK